MQCMLETRQQVTLCQLVIRVSTCLDLPLVFPGPLYPIRSLCKIQYEAGSPFEGATLAVQTKHYQPKPAPSCRSTHTTYVSH